MVIKAKELGVGYFCDYEDTLYLVSAPIIYCNEQGQYHNEKRPAISWGKHEELYYIEGVKLDKEWHTKIVKDKLTPDEVFAIDNAEHRRIAYKYMDKSKLTQLPDYRVIDEKKDSQGNTMRVLSFTVQNMDKPIRMYNCICPTTKREYFLGTDKDTCEDAKDDLYGLSNVEWVNEW